MCKLLLLTFSSFRFHCAAKMVHKSLITEAPNKVVGDFIRECKILSSLHHPNIVQFVGISGEGKVILMEYLHAPLIVFIDEHSRAQKCLDVRTLSLEQKLKILYDVALGLQYLHERDRPILHRDLTANNILLTETLRAKIADLGQAIVKQHNHQQYLSQAPGTLCYMPPEVLISNPKYDQSIDIFSFGVLILHTISEIWPIPEVDAQILDSQSGEVAGCRSEFDRRPKCTEKIATMPQLTSLVKQCLHNSARHRPPVILVIGRLALASSEEKDSEDNILAVSYINKELDQTNYNLKITLAEETSQVNKLCVIVRSPFTLGFTGTYKGTIPFLRKPSLPRDIAITENGSAYVCDSNGYAGVLVYDVESHQTRAIVQAAPRLSTKKSSENKCWYPQGIATDDCGNVYLSDTHNHRVLKYSPMSELLSVVGEMSRPGSADNRFNQPSGITLKNEIVYICDTENHRVLILDNYLHYLAKFRHDSMRRPIDIAIDKEGKFVYVLDCSNNSIHIFRGGSYESLHTIDLKDPQYLKLQKPSGICVDNKNFIYVTDKQKHGVLVLDAARNFKMFFGTQGCLEGEFSAPCGIDVDSLGNVYICDSGNKRVQVFS